MSKRTLVLVAVDGSHETEGVVEYALSVASVRGAELHAVQVVPRDGSLWRAPMHERELRSRLRDLRPMAEGANVPFRIVTLRGMPERAIPAYAQLASASLIVVGRNYGTLSFWRGIAVANRLSRLSPVPVLVLPTLTEKSTSWSPKRILTAVDSSVASAMALRASVDLSKRYGAPLTIVHVTNAPDPTAFSGFEGMRLVRQLRDEMSAVAEQLKRKAIALGSANAEPTVVTGYADRGIVDTATKTAASLIVMGVAPRTRFDQAVFGSTLRGVLRRAKIPVLVLPVVGGGHEWIDVVTGESAVGTASTGDAIVRRAA